MSTHATLEIFAMAFWGEGPDEVPLVLQDYPLFGEMATEQVRQVRAAVRIRLDSQNGLHALADAVLGVPGRGSAFINHFDVSGKATGRTPIFLPGEQGLDQVVILDYVVDHNHDCYLLEQMRPHPFGQPTNRLRKISSDGEPRWSSTGPFSSGVFDFHQLQGNFTRLLMDGHSRLYLPGTEHAGVIAEFSPSTGDVVRLYRSDKFSNKVFMDEYGTVFYVLYFPDLNRRGFGRFSLEHQQLTTFVGDTDLYGWLLYPLGVDAMSNMYAWKESSIARISPNGQIAILATVDNVVTRSQDGAVFSSRLRRGGQPPVVEISRYLPGEEPGRQELQLPGELSAQQGEQWKLIHVDERQRYYIFGGEEPGRAGTVLVYSPSGTLEEMMSPPPELPPLESRLASHLFWQIDSGGRVYLPVTDGQGFKVVRLHASNQVE